jgi:hypothetical protein
MWHQLAERGQPDDLVGHARRHVEQEPALRHRVIAVAHRPPDQPRWLRRSPTGQLRRTIVAWPGAGIVRPAAR